MKQSTLASLFILALVLVLVGYLLKVKPKNFKYIADPIVTPNPQPTPYKMDYPIINNEKPS